MYAECQIRVEINTGCSLSNGTQVNGYNFVTVDLIYLKFCRYKDKILNDKHGKN